MPVPIAILDLVNSIRRIFGGAPSPVQPVEPAGQKPLPVTRKVDVLIFNPTVPSEGSRRLSDIMGWGDSNALADGFAQDIRDASDGYANYQIVRREVIDAMPAKADGYIYDPDYFLQCLRNGSGFHSPDQADVLRIMNEHGILPRIKSGEIDEVWMFGPPYAGFYESQMAGPGAFRCNSGPLGGADAAGRRFVIMGFNYERGAGEMLENMGHRSEDILKFTFRNLGGDANLWQRFIRYDKTNPGQAEAGNVHFAPNSQSDYDWGNPRTVPSGCDRWYKFPDLSGPARMVSCTEWGSGNMRAHHMWWFKHFPRITGQANGVGYNWWAYLIDPNQVK
ncbi:MAG TPA: hypothetical protein VFF78_02985 [Anaerolineaceae bacterium]|nr:hypothetical protein [Anaerolineaceae bacterium]